MIKIKMKSKWNFTLVVPYFALHIATSIICSEFVWKKITRPRENLNKKTTEIYSSVNRNLVKPLIKTAIKEAQKHRGKTIVEIQASDGHEIFIRL